MGFPTIDLMRTGANIVLPTVDNLIVLAALLHVRIDDILVTDNAVA